MNPKVTVSNSNLKLTVSPRKSGQIERKTSVPAVLYGPQIEKGICFYLTLNDIREIRKNGSKEINLELEDKTYNTLIQGVQYHPVTDQIIHVDFLNIILEKSIKVQVALEFINIKDNSLVKLGAKFNIARNSLEVWCKGHSIIDKLVIDVQQISSSKTLFARDLKWPVEVWIPKNSAVASIISKKES